MSTSLLDLAELLIEGQAASKAYANVLDAVTDKGVSMKETITGASTVEMTLNDPRRALLRSGLFASRVTLVLDGAGFELASVRKNGTTLDLTFEDAAVAELRRRKGAKVVAAGTMSRAQFCAYLCRDVPWIKVAMAPGAKSQVQLARGSATSTATTESGGGMGDYGIPLTPAAGSNVVPADVILRDGERHGAAASAAASTTSTATTTIPTLAPTVVAATKTQAKKDDEDSWTAMGRIMGEIGWRVMARRKGIIVAPDSWLMSHAAATYTLGESSPGVDMIDVEWDTGKPAATATLTVWAGAYDLAAGSPVTLTGMGVANGTWLVESIERTAHTKRATVTAIRPQPTFAEPADASSDGSGIGGEGGYGGYGLINDSGTAVQQTGSENSGPGTSRGARFVQYALAQRGKAYVGGTHGPSSFDCSGLVMAAAASVGVTFPAPVSSQSKAIVDSGNLIPVAQGVATRGAVLYRGTPGINGGMSGSDHIAISLGNGQTIEARGRAYGVGVFDAKGRSWSGAGLIPGIGPA